MDMFIASLSRVVLGQKRARPAERKDFETAKSGGYPFYAQLDVRTMTLWLLPYWCIMYGAQLAMITTHRTGFTSNALAIKWPIIPFRTVIGKFTFIANLTVRICDIHPLDTAYRLAIRRIIPLSSDIVKACENRDLATVQGLLECRKYGPNDMTEDYRPLLWYAIRGGSLEITSCLLSSGADATVLSSCANSSLLQIAFYCRQPEIARLLMTHGADPENINLFGRTPLFQLFQPDREPVVSLTTALIDILTSGFLSSINTQSCCNSWTALHRAAAFGKGQDVKILVDRGANPTLKTSDEQWMPIFIAVKFNNIDTFEQLMTYSRKCIEDTDVRGWTLLHIAAALGSSELITRLVQLGANPRALSNVSESGNDLVLENMLGKQLTPDDVAKYSGTEQHDRYIRALRDADC